MPKEAAPFIKVRALAPGYYGHGPKGELYRDTDSVFAITPRQIVVTNTDDKHTPKVDAEGNPITKMLSCEQQFSSNWMERVDDDTPEVLVTAKHIMKQYENEINAKKSA